MFVLIENCGCDDRTKGLAEFDSEKDLNNFIRIILDLNRNSYYGCMPTIDLYEIKKEELREIKLEDYQTDDCFENNYIERNQLLFLKHKIYTFVDEFREYTIETESRDLIKRYLLGGF
jgi:hypothetical protein